MSISPPAGHTTSAAGRSQAAGHVLRRQLGYWLDPDGLYWHEFQSAVSSSLSFTGWRHSGPPRRSLSLTELVIQRFSPQQQAEILRFQDEKLRMRRELREVQHRLNADIDALGNRLKLINILGMPALVVLVALLVAWRRWSRRRAAES